MPIEETLSSIDTSLKMIVTILQSAGAITAPASLTPAAESTAVEKKTRAKKSETVTTASVVEGDAEGTLYFVSEELLTVYAQTKHGFIAKPRQSPGPQPDWKVGAGSYPFLLLLAIHRTNRRVCPRHPPRRTRW